jgi:hypothetical protein
MLKVIAKAISASRAWILLIAFLVAIVAVVESSQPFQECVKETYYNPATENFEKSITSFSAAFGTHRDCFGNFTHDNAEAIIAAFTIILSFSTIFLWVATRDLVRGVENTAKQQLRAYLSIELAVRDGPHQVVPEFKAKIIFKNCGQTPAYDGALWMHIYASPQDSAIPPLERIITFEMPPSNAITVWRTIETNKLLFSNEALDGFENGTVAIYIHGRADFKDAFHKDRWFVFRLRYDKRCFATGFLNTEEIKSN